MITENIGRIMPVLSMPAFSGQIVMLATSGLFKLELAPLLLIASVVIAGPGAFSIALLFDGTIAERMIAALVAGMIATILTMAVAGAGPRLLAFVDMRMLKLFGGFAVIIIGLMVAGLKIPSKAPLIVMFIGLVFAVVSALR
jgi:hypothetical protein